METLTETKELPSVRFAKVLMESKRQTEIEVKWENEHNPEKKAAIIAFKNRNLHK